MLEEELTFAGDLADRAAEIGLGLFERGLEARLKADRTPVTEADVRIEELVRAEVARRFPSDSVVGEEGGGQLGAGRGWIVDPIDGTRNFAARIQVWATLIALVEDGEPLLGVVSAPALGERYTAVRSLGATLNGQPIHVSDSSSLRDAVVCHYATEEWVEGPHGEKLLQLVSDAGRSVGFTDFWGHCLVARGSVDVVLEPALQVWDWAALKVVVEEAGGRMSAIDGGPCRHGGSILATNGHLHDEVIRRFRTGAEAGA